MRRLKRPASPHQVGIIKSFLGARQGSPADAEPTRRVPRSKVAIEDDAIDAIVAAGEEIVVKLPESVCHRQSRLAVPRNLGKLVRTAVFELLLCDFSPVNVDIKQLPESAGSRALWLWPPNVRCGAGDSGFRMRLHLRPRTAGPIATTGK